MVPQPPSPQAPIADQVDEPTWVTPTGTSPFSRVFRSSRTRSRVVLIALGVVGAILFLSAFHEIAGFQLIHQAELGTLTVADADSYDSTTQGLAGLFLIGLIATAISYLAWLSRAVDNIPSLTGRTPQNTPRWAIGWWFVPFANLFKPYQVVKEVQLLLAQPGVRVGTALTLAWWLTWAIGNVFAGITSRLPEPQNLTELSGYFTVNLVSDLLLAVAAVLAFLVVRRTQGLEDARAALVPAPVAVQAASSAQSMSACPRCAVPRVPGEQRCANCGFDYWAAYDQANPPRAAE